MNIKIENCLLTLCFILFLSISSFGQSRFEYGIGIGINHSRISEDISNLSGSIVNRQDGLRMPALMTRIGYKMNENFHINTGPGFSWFGSFHHTPSTKVVASTFEIPLQVEWNIHHNFHFSTGPVYNYIIGITNQNDMMDFDMLPLVESRHQIGFKHGIAFSYDLVELSLNYSHYLTEVFNLALLDVNGEFFGTLVSKFRNIQIGIVIRR